MSRDGGVAFPSPTGNISQDGQLTVRDYFAAAALAILSNAELIKILHRQCGDDRKDESELAARFAYEVADAMLEERRR